MKKEVYIRADGSAQLGLGHLVRSLALAHMIGKDFLVRFFSRDIPEKISADICKAGFSLTRIANEDEFFSVLTQDDIVVLDHYEMGAEYQKKIKSRGCKLVCIDDLHDKEFYADLIINHTPGITGEDYRAQSYTQYALGLDYALLRPAFLDAAKEKEKKFGKMETFFVCFGGADPENLTGNTVAGLLKFNPECKINIVLGESFQYAHKLQEYLNDYPEGQLNVYQGLDENRMAGVMKESDIAVVPASGILLESIAIGLVIISGMYVENQKFLYHNYLKAGAFIDAGNFSRENLQAALEQLNRGSKPSGPRIDGRSGSRIQRLFRDMVREEGITLRQANFKDVDLTYEWAKNPRVRAYSFSTHEIQYEEHRSWFLNKIENKQTLYFIAEYQEKAIGSLRYDLHKEEAVISFLIDPQFHGEGFGKMILKKGYEKLTGVHRDPTLKKVVGYVKPENIPSFKTFQRLGYSLASGGEKGLKFYKNI